MKKMKILLICSLYNSSVFYALDTDDVSKFRDAVKAEIIRFYGDEIATCGALVSVNSRSPLSGGADADMACLIAGKRDIVLDDLQGAIDRLLGLIEVFRIGVKTEGIKELDGVSYRPEGERMALLLVKHRLIERIEDKYNDCLTGLLLEYDVQDIVFYYQRSGFVRRFGFLPFQYAKFSDGQKQRFNAYLQNDWQTERRYFAFAIEEAARWLAEQERYTNQELYQQIEELKQKEDK